MNKIHFCGGLPRTCSTVLMNILQQNPRIFTTGTCALPTILKDKILIESRTILPFMAMDPLQADAAMYGFIHGATKGWFEGLTDKPVVISKNRNWNNLYHLYPNSKYICLVRDLRDIVESLEKLNRETKALHTIRSKTFHIALNEYQKFDAYFNTDDNSNTIQSVLSQEIKRLIEINNQDKKKILFLRTEDFIKFPNESLDKVYKHIGERKFNHDLNNIEQQTLYEHDNVYFSEKTNHKTASKLIQNKPISRTLSKDFHDLVVKKNVWFYELFYPEVLQNEF